MSSLYTFDHFIYEFRFMTSLFAVFFCFYYIKIFDQLFVKLFVRYLSKKISVPVLIDDFTFILDGAVEIKGCSLLVPENERDLWKNQVLLYIGIIVIKFNTLKLLTGFISSGFTVLNIKRLTVMNVIVNVEGRQVPCESVDLSPSTGRLTTTFVNLKLIGNKRRKRQRKLTQKEQRAAKKPIKVSMEEPAGPVFQNEEVRCNAEFDVDFEQMKSCSSPHAVIGTNTVYATPIKGQNPLSRGLSKFIGKATDFIAQANEHKSFFSAAKSVMKKVSTELKHEAQHIYDKAKTKIETTLENSFASLVTEVHEKFRGGEPIPDSSDYLARAEVLRVIDITLNVEKALPRQLKHLEANPFTVLESKITNQGVEMNSMRHHAGLRMNDLIDKSDLRPFWTLPSETETGVFILLYLVYIIAYEVFVALGTSIYAYMAGLDKEVDRDADDGECVTDRYTEIGPIPVALLQYRLERAIVSDMLKDNAQRMLFETFDWRGSTK